MKIRQTPKNLVYLSMTLKIVNRLQTYLTDQDKTPIDLRGEQLTIRFHLCKVNDVYDKLSLAAKIDCPVTDGLTPISLRRKKDVTCLQTGLIDHFFSIALVV